MEFKRACKRANEIAIEIFNRSKKRTMTRTEIAAMAMQGLLSSEETSIEGETFKQFTKRIARVSVDYADALLEKLAETEKGLDLEKNYERH